jgi:hypothetical protein
MFDLNSIQETTKYFTNQFTNKDVKEFTKKSQDFLVSLIDANAKATYASIEAFGTLAGSEFTKYLLPTTQAVDQLTENAKEIIKSGTFKIAPYAGHKK